MAEGTHERPIGIGFRQYSWKVACRAFKDIKWMRDMAIGACLSVASVVLRASWGIMSRSDWKLHERQWIANIVLPIVAWMAVRIAYSLLTAPWRVHQDQESVHDVEKQAMRVELCEKNILVEQLLSPADRPRLVFERWGQIPAGHHVARPIAPTVAGQFLQNGFHFINDGGAAHEVMVEPFKFEDFEAKSSVVTRIGQEGGFALVWVAQPLHLQSAHSPGMWDLQGAMALADAHAHPLGMYQPDYSVRVVVVYRDGNSVWYRTTATLMYIRSQHRLEFRDITHEKGSPTRPL